tara:strand:+ start:537 stop:761 length:225 start_codon:yes stop_codon:yes gene_type:complete
LSQPNQVVVSQVSDVTTVEITTQGPQGPSFASSGKTMNDSNVVDGSLVRFHASSDTFIADNTVTVTNIVDGGNF